MKAVLTLTVGLTLAAPAIGQQMMCAPMQDMRRFLSVQYSEHPVGLGLIANGNVLQRFESEGGKSWTMIVVTPEGMSCILSAGESWARVLPPEKGRQG